VATSDDSTFVINEHVFTYPDDLQRDQVRDRIRSAIEAHLRSMRADGDPIPQPASVAETVEVAA